MNREDDILRAAERLYAAVAAPEAWRPALEAIADLVGGSHATLDVHGARQIGLEFVVAARVDEASLARTLASEVMSVAIPLLAAIPIGVSSRNSVISDQDYARSAAYNEMFRPLGGFHSIHVRRNSTHGMLLSICRPQRAESFDDADVAALGRLAPHLTTALVFRERLTAAETRSGDLVRVLDQLRTAVILADADARALLLNARAEQIIAEADGLFIDAGRVSTATLATTRRLGETIAAVASGRVSEPGRIRVERSTGRLPLLLSVLPLWRLEGTFSGIGERRVAILVDEPDAAIRIDRFALCEVFRLTPRESEVAEFIAAGLELDAIAAQLRIGRGTARSYLGQVFQKTDTHSRAALTALVHRFAGRLH